ncbi:quinohemoprotein amine dehydrogenase subunit alpha [Pseudomonas sp. Marseille-Q5117]|uniref:quinohemoprotein amine dehydrogenase subunit alpha n=1 Tax=Pseudomonas sp. Marseille-Q5117 TaxID=2972777 RepID=UPI0021C8C000|nr:quinohemoprotein amine dehydrogenase subunit alpha [Pseudomonas sp. Marseille-Q5117]
MRDKCALALTLQPIAFAISLAIMPVVVYAESAADAKALLTSKCVACHLPQEGGMNRIDQSRRTPEGWDMTIGRMISAHGVRLTSDERQTLVKYLADTHGLAPEETQKRRYILERDFTLIETPDDKKVSETCARCHSYARIALQRRTPEDWKKLANFHVGQYPTIEIQQGGRDRDWWDIASKEMPETLGKLYPYQSEIWNKWMAAQKSSAAGKWRVVGHRPGWGTYEGIATIAGGNDRYTLDMQINYANGKTEKAEGKAIVYTGYEWRGSMKQGELQVAQVFQLSQDGKTLSGRWHQAGVDSVGGHLKAVRIDKNAPTQILAIAPIAIKAGSTKEVTIYGANLSGKVNLGQGLTIKRVISESTDKVVVEVAADANVTDGIRSLDVGGVPAQQGLAVYSKIDFVGIEPDAAMARIGGGGGPLPKVPVQFEAVAYAVGPDGKKDTADDLRLGYVPATWTMENLNANAEEMKDLEFAGTIEPGGLFIPGDAGPNPKRKYSTNNAGELNVIASVDDEGKKVKAAKPLIVTVQRWNDPPIR